MNIFATRNEEQRRNERERDITSADAAAGRRGARGTSTRDVFIFLCFETSLVRAYVVHASFTRASPALHRRDARSSYVESSRSYPNYLRVMFIFMDYVVASPSSATAHDGARAHYALAAMERSSMSTVRVEFGGISCTCASP